MKISKGFKDGYAAGRAETAPVKKTAKTRSVVMKGEPDATTNDEP